MTHESSASHPATGATLSGWLRQAEVAMEQQRRQVAAARLAIVELERLYEGVEAEAAECGDPDRSAALQGQAADLARRLEVLRRQLDGVENAGAEARAQSLGLRRLEAQAADALPFAAGPPPFGES